jgi:hypothetical protein
VSGWTRSSGSGQILAAGSFELNDFLHGVRESELTSMDAYKLA